MDMNQLINWATIAGVGVLVMIVVGIVVVIVGGRAIALKKSMNAEDGYTSSRNLDSYIGVMGVTQTVLRPGGMVEIDGKRMDARAQGEYIEADVKVRVIDIDGAQLVVDEAQVEQ